MPASTSTQSLSDIFPARRSSQYFQASEPEPSVLPFQLPRSIGPARRQIAGKFTVVAPNSSAGVVLSPPPIRTTPSPGLPRHHSPASLAHRLPHSRVTG